jgi:hypothetical protein
LLVGPRIEVSYLAGELGGDDAVCGDKRICEGSFAMVLSTLEKDNYWQALHRRTDHMGHDTYVANIVGCLLELNQLLRRDNRHVDVLTWWWCVCTVSSCGQARRWCRWVVWRMEAATWRRGVDARVSRAMKRWSRENKEMKGSCLQQVVTI